MYFFNENIFRSQEVRHQYKSDTPELADVPRYRHPSFQEVSTKYALRKNKPKMMNMDSLRIARDPAKDSQIDNSQNEASAADFYQAMRDKRRNEINVERETGKVNNMKSSPERRRSAHVNKLKSSPVSSDPQAPGLTLKQRIEARRAALEAEEGGNKADKDKNISLSDIASKAEFVRKMSKTFGYGMPSNAESKPDTLTSEAEKCALLVKSASKKNNINKPKRRKSGDTDKTKKEKKAKPHTNGAGSRERECGDAAPRIETWDFSSSKLQQPQQQRKKPGSGGGGGGLHSSVAPIVPELDIEIDPELDCLLAQLEHDESFSKLGENEQKAWLESLFFQDTTHLPGRMSLGQVAKSSPRDQLKPAKSNPKSQLRVNRDAAGGGGEAGAEAGDPDTVTAVHVNDKMKNLAQDFFKADTKQTNRNSLPARTMTENITVKSIRKMSDSSFDTKSLSSIMKESLRGSAPKDDSSSPSSSFIPSPALSRKSSVASFATPPTSRKGSEVREPARSSGSIEESCDRISVVNDSLCSLAQSYFSAPASAPSPQREISRKPSFKEETNCPSKEEEQKASLVASFFGPGPTKPSNPVSKPSPRKPAAPSPKVPERASYEPEGQEDVSDEEDDDIEALIKAAELELKMKNEAPPPPER